MSEVRFYIFHGEDEFGCSEKLARLKERMGDPTMANLNTTVLDGSQVTLADLRLACDAAPFMAKRRLILVKGLLTRLEPREKRGERSPWQKKYLKELVDYLKQLPDTTRLVFVEGKTIGEDNPAYRLALSDEHGFVKKVKLPSEGELSGWIRERARAKGAQIEPAAARELATFVGDNLRLLDQEIEKLIAYTDGARPISQDDVRLLTSYVREANIFHMVDALGRRDGQRASKLLHRLLDDGAHPLALLGMIVRQFRIMIQVKELAGRGLRPRAIGAKLGLRNFVVRKGLRQARGFSMARLEGIYRKLLETDLAIKTGK
ncbi:MAG: DNA polymerase III subunit delta, partial [Chloroflexota bacterium]|nr:DNA polymerase III subunit delta [Chloroflexota bacterium]